MPLTRQTVLRASVAAAALFAVAVGTYECDQQSNSSVAHAIRPVVNAGNCIVTGTVRYAGPPLPPPKIIGTGCCPGSPPIHDESIRLGSDSGVADVFVYIKDGPNVPDPPGRAVPTLNQKCCQYVPHALSARTAEPIRMTSDDATMHNVHIEAGANPAENFSETEPGASHEITFAEPDFVHVKCDVHPWMSATIGVFDNPFHAATASDGSFSIDRLPPGRYTLVAHHEQLGDLTQAVIVDTHHPATAAFTYR